MTSHDGKDRGMNYKKWILRSVLVIAVGIIIAALVTGLWRAWMEWWAGESLSEQDLWGWRILYWGRVGLCLQFVAGLVVVLDLVGPERLRQWGERAASRTDSQAHRIQMAIARRRLLGRFADLCNCLRADLSNVTADWPPHTSPPNTGDNWHEDRVRTDGYHALLLCVYEEFGGQFVCNDTHGADWGPHNRVKCEDGMRVIHPLVREFVTEEARAEGKAEAVRVLNQPVSATLFLAIVTSSLLLPLFGLLGAIVIVIAVLGLVGPAGPVFLGAIVTLVLASLSPVGSVLIEVVVERILLLPVLLLSKRKERYPRAYRFFRDRLRRWTHNLTPASAGPRVMTIGTAIRWQPVRGATRLLAILLDKAEPGYVLRWIAFTLFVVGFHFLLLAT